MSPISRVGSRGPDHYHSLRQERSPQQAVPARRSVGPRNPDLLTSDLVTPDLVTPDLVYMNSQTAYLGLGSNLGDRASYLLQAVQGLLDHRLPVRALSPLYETDPVGYLDQPSFLNMVLAIDGSGWDPWRLLAVCQAIETSLGRRRSIPQGPRTIDLDLLFFGQQVIAESRQGVDLVLPHPRLAVRPFVLIPLSDLAPAFLHPVLGKTVAQLLAAVSPQTPSSPTVRRYDPGGGQVRPGWQEPLFHQQN